MILPPNIIIVQSPPSNGSLLPPDSKVRDDLVEGLSMKRSLQESYEAHEENSIKYVQALATKVKLDIID